ncbi:MAG: PIN domain-containing protein [Nitrospirota bacterium]
MGIYIVDTQATVWFLTDKQRLGIEARKALNDPKSQIYISHLVFDEIRHKFERFKKGDRNKTIGLPPIICWLISKKSKNVKLKKQLSSEDIEKLKSKYPDLRKLQKVDMELCAIQLLLNERYPRTEVRIITSDNQIRKISINELRTCW